MKFNFPQYIPVYGLTAIFIFLSSASISQNLNLNFALGGSNYQGDLSNSYTSALKPAISGGFTINLLDNIRLRTNLSFLQIGANDGNSPKQLVKERNLNFKTDIFEAAELLEVDLLNSEDNSFVPYLFGGASYYRFDPTTTLKESDRINFNNVGLPMQVGEKIHLHDIGTEGQLFRPIGINTKTYTNRVYDLTQTNWQLGAGIRMQLSEAVSIAYEFSFRKLGTDFLDDASEGNYIGGNEWKAQINDALASNDLSRAKLLRQGEALSWRKLDKSGNPIVLPSGNPNYPRGNPNFNDAYFSNQIRINITIFDLFGSYNGSGRWGGREFYNSKRKKLFSPNNPFGTGQLRCPRIY